MNCKGKKFGHNFPFSGAKCENCGISQQELSFGKPKKVENEDYLDKIRKRHEKAKNDRTIQPTMHQQDAIETAEMFNDLKSKGIYLRIFKKYPLNRPDLLKCREWVMEKIPPQYRGRTFVKHYKKFIK